MSSLTFSTSFPDPTIEILTEVTVKLARDPAKVVVSYLFFPRSTVFLDLTVLKSKQVSDTRDSVNNSGWSFDEKEVEKFNRLVVNASVTAAVGVVMLQERKPGVSLLTPEQYKTFFERYPFSKSIFACTNTDSHSEWVNNRPELNVAQCVKIDLQGIFVCSVQDRAFTLQSFSYY